MEKITIKKDLFCLLWTQTILDTHLEENVNFMALEWKKKADLDIMGHDTFIKFKSI